MKGLETENHVANLQSHCLIPNGAKLDRVAKFSLKARRKSLGDGKNDFVSAETEEKRACAVVGEGGAAGVDEGPPTAAPLDASLGGVDDLALDEANLDNPSTGYHGV